MKESKLGRRHSDSRQLGNPRESDPSQLNSIQWFLEWRTQSCGRIDERRIDLGRRHTGRIGRAINRLYFYFLICQRGGGAETDRGQERTGLDRTGRTGQDNLFLPDGSRLPGIEISRPKHAIYSSHHTYMNGNFIQGRPARRVIHTDIQRSMIQNTFFSSFRIDISRHELTNYVTLRYTILLTLPRQKANRLIYHSKSQILEIQCGFPSCEVFKFFTFNS